MREILFRGKRKDNGEWIQGDFCSPCNIVFLENGYDAVLGKDDCPMCNDFEVLPETVGQYTGLTDKNGKKIFEGDIVKEEYEVFVSARKKEKRTKIGYVEYESSSLCCGYYAYFWNEKEKWRGNFNIHHCCEVIGNIHDNPELLKGGAE